MSVEVPFAEMIAPVCEPDLAAVRRIEAVSFRSFPATSLYYDRTWAIRLTAGHPAKRLNSINPLDPLDNAGIAARIGIARDRFKAYGRQMTIRQTPLAPPELVDLLDNEGWNRFEHSLVMVASLDSIPLDDAVDHLPLKDIGRWVDRFLAISGEPEERRAGMVEVISAIQPETGLFLNETPDGEPVSAVRCVRDGNLAGIFELETNPLLRRRGHGEAILQSALKWARANGATSAWLQVVADNRPAISLYHRHGFRTQYGYCYRRPPE